MLGIFLDVETSGLDFFKHRILEIAFKIIDISTGEEKKVYHAIIQQSKKVWEQRDPASVIFNGFTWDKVLMGKDEQTIAQEIIQLFSELEIVRGKAIYICQNPAFDRSFFSQLIDVYTQERLKWPYHWLDLASMYWVIQVKKIADEHLLFPENINLSKNAIAHYYQLPDEPNPHTAMNGVEHLITCYKAVVGFRAKA